MIVHANAQPRARRSGRRRDPAAGGSAEAVAFDVADGDARARPSTRCSPAVPIQVVVNNAGIHDDAPLAGMTRRAVEARDRRVAARLLPRHPAAAAADGAHALGPHRQRVVGRGVLGNRGQVNYAAAKSALHGASKSLAREMASRGITVNVVAPGVIAGRMADDSFAPEQIKAMVPAGRAGTPEEVAALVRSCVRTRPVYINGQVIGINGGMS